MMRTVFDNAQAAFSHFSTPAMGGRRDQVWINDGTGKNTLKAVTLTFRWQNDRLLMDSGAVIICDANLICRAADLPRRPLPGELLHYPRNQVWQVTDSYESQGLYFVALNQNRTSSQ
jgi:hypothetical protein